MIFLGGLKKKLKKTFARVKISCIFAVRFFKKLKAKRRSRILGTVIFTETELGLIKKLQKSFGGLKKSFYFCTRKSEKHRQSEIW